MIMFDTYALAGFAILAEGLTYAAKFISQVRFSPEPENQRIKVSLRRYELPTCQRAVNTLLALPTPLDIISMTLHVHKYHSLEERVAWLGR